MLTNRRLDCWDGAKPGGSCRSRPHARKACAFLISISGAGVPADETTIDQAQNEMRALGMRPEAIQQIVGLMKLQDEFARSGRGWNEYVATREKIAAGRVERLIHSRERRTIHIGNSFGGCISTIPPRRFVGFRSRRSRFSVNWITISSWKRTG